MADKIVTNEELADMCQQVLDILVESRDEMTVVFSNKDSVKEVRMDGNVFEQFLQEIVASN